MKDFFNSVLVAFSMFSVIPVPKKRVRWDGQGMKYIMAAFPIVGIVIGAVVFVWIWLSGRLGLPDVLRALGLTLIPIALTGGIHLDGFADTCDALKSNASPERRREILKDPRAGAFAVIGVAVYLVAYFGLAAAFDPTLPNVVLLCTGFVMTRVISGMSVLLIPSAGSGTVKAFHDAAAARSAGILMIFVFLWIIGAGFAGAFSPARSLVSSLLWIIAGGASALYLAYTAKRKFGGMSGDLAGWFLQICEIAQLAVIVVCTHWRFQ